MNIGIFTYGTRGDVQPYIALASGLKDKGHSVILAAPENFKGFVEGFGLTFHPLYGNVEEMMNSPEGESVLRSENTIRLMKHFFKVLNAQRRPLRESFLQGINKVDAIIANAAMAAIVCAIAEKQSKKIAFTYFMPPMAVTGEFPIADFDFLNFPWYNRLTYKLAHAFYWKFVKAETNEYRQELGLPVLKENLLYYIDRKKMLDLYCISSTLTPQPKDWEPHHQITGVLTVAKKEREGHVMDKVPAELSEWLAEGPAPIYMGFGSNGIGNTEKFNAVINEVLNKTDERILFCTGWSKFDNLPQHKNLFVTKYVDHEAILPKCKMGIFHGGAGTFAAMLRNHLPVIIVSFYTDQPAWGKIAERRKLGTHIPLRKLTGQKLVTAINVVQHPSIKQNVIETGDKIKAEDGLGNTINAIEKYFA
ncbi:MAG TPA: glycosyltransferase [Mucilaginibacter sp.]|nr:glycosyltransferase [Mucilaginibacter sp.]